MVVEKKLLLALSCATVVSAGWLLRSRRRRRKKFAPLLRDALSRARERFSKKAPLMVSPMEGQLGGLAHAETKAMLVAKEAGLVLKPVQAKGLGLREVAFYEFISEKETKLQRFLCGYHGVVDHEDHAYLCLDDSTRSLKRPCAMDVKIGTKTYEAEAPLEKKRRESEKYPAQLTLGCRVVGMRVFNKDDYVTYDKHFGYGLKDEVDTLRAFRRFFGASPPKKRKVLQRAFLRKLKVLRHIFEANDHPFNFISSSLFFVYDADDEDDDGEDEGSEDEDDEDTLSVRQARKRKPRVDLRLIDFAHVRYDAKRDDGCLVGIQTLIRIFDRLLLDDL